jgi:hypothetical protein
MLVLRALSQRSRCKTTERNASDGRGERGCVSPKDICVGRILGDIRLTATWVETSPECRWWAHDNEELVKKDKCSLDVFWLRDESLEDSDNLPTRRDRGGDCRGSEGGVGAVCGDSR